MGNVVGGKTSHGFERWEVGLLEKMFRDLAKRSPGDTIDKATFLKLFNLPGMVGERLFAVFDTKKNDVIDFSEFMAGLQQYSRGTIDDKIRTMFKMYDLTGDNAVDAEELTTMLHSLITSPLEILEESDTKHEEDTIKIVESIVKDAFRTCDLQKNGLLSYEEFKRFISQSSEVTEQLEEALVRNSWDAALSHSPEESSLRVFDSVETIECQSCGWTPKHCYRCGQELRRLDCERCGPLFQDVSLVKFCMKCGSALVVRAAKQSFVSVAVSCDSRDIVRSGYLYKKSSLLRTLKKRWIVLTKGFLYSYRDQKQHHPSHIQFIQGCFIEIESSQTNGSQQFGFSISSDSDEKFLLYASSAEERQNWVNEMRKAAQTVPISDIYEIGRVIGKGKFATVHEGVHKVSRETYAIKVLDKSRIDKAGNESLRSEIAILNVARHPNIVKMKQVFETRDKMFIVLYLYPHGDLYRFMKQKSTRFSETECKKIAWSIVNAVSYLHSMGIVHRDLKPENILMNNPHDISDIVLSDFGLSKFATPKEEMKLACGTLSYCAPEVLTMTGYSKAVDFWSIGVILYMLLAGKLPFAGTNQRDTIRKILKAKVSFHDRVWENVSDDAKRLIRDLLEKNPEERPDCKSIRDYKWFEDCR